LSTISIPFGYSRKKTHRARILWREIGVGLGIALLGLALTALAIKAGGTWPDTTAARPTAPLTHSMGPALFRPDALPVP
jgi:hypothetical protein